MKRFAMISGHEPTALQIEASKRKNIQLAYVGYTNGFTITPEWINRHGYFDGVVVDHAGAAMRLRKFYPVGVFGNANILESDQPLDYKEDELHIYSSYGDY